MEGHERILADFGDDLVSLQKCVSPIGQPQWGTSATRESCVRCHLLKNYHLFEFVPILFFFLFASTLDSSEDLITEDFVTHDKAKQHSLEVSIA